MCGNSTNCHTYHGPSVRSRGCFLHWLKLSASICCRLEVSPGHGHWSWSPPAPGKSQRIVMVTVPDSLPRGASHQSLGPRVSSQRNTRVS